MYQLRPVTHDDREFLYQTTKRTVKEYVIQTFGQWDDAFQRDRFEKKFDPALFQIIVVANRDIGLLGVTEDEETIFIRNIYILPEFQNQGLGTEILQDLLAEAKHKNRSVTLRVLCVNPAKHLYKRLGFNVIEETDLHYLMRFSDSE